jgi:GT2 family glycosyltransferase
VTTKPRLSVVVLTHGPEDIVRPCLDSLRPVVESGLAELVVVDNGTPGFDIEDFRQRHPWLRAIANSANLGFAAGNNVGLRETSGDYVLLLNPDTVVPRSTLPAMVEFMDGQPAVGAATCRVNLAGGGIDPACHRGFPTPWASFAYYSRLSKLLPSSRLMGGYHLGWLSLDTTHDIECPSGCFFLVRRAVVEQVGLLDEDYFMYGEDVDWAWRMKQSGWRIVYHPAVSIIHHKGMSSGIKNHSATDSAASPKDRERAHRAFYDAMRIFYRKHWTDRYPFFTRWLVFAGIWLREHLTRKRLAV